MVIGAEKRSMDPDGWSADWSVAAGWSTTVASQVDGDDDCSTGQWRVLCLHNGAHPSMYTNGWPSQICGTSS